MELARFLLPNFVCDPFLPWRAHKGAIMAEATFEDLDTSEDVQIKSAPDPDPGRQSRPAIADDVFRLLKTLGPLCTSQLAAELGLSIKKIKSGLSVLEDQDLVQQSPDRDPHRTFSETEIPWSLRRFFNKRIPSRN
ncbi:MAG TPA: ArsR family transcriptional regulator [Thermoanaerobaculia bacterium]|jgi:hypothetical protein